MCYVKIIFKDATTALVKCFAVVALDAHDNDISCEDHSVKLYAPVTSSEQITQLSANTCFLSKFRQFCKV